MATLQKIRNRAGLLIIVIGVALLAFVVGDGLRSGGTLAQGDRATVLKVNGEKIGYELYLQRLNQMTEAVEAQGRKLTDEMRMSLNNQLAQEFVQDAAVMQISKETGIVVSPKEYWALVTGEGLEQSYGAIRFFQQVGVDPADKEAIYDLIEQTDPKVIQSMPAEYQFFYHRLRADWQNLTSLIINERIIEKYSTILSRTYTLNKLDREHLARADRRSVAFVRTPSLVYSDSVPTPSDSEARAYYQAHSRNYALPQPYTKVDYVSLQVRPDQEDYQQAEATMLETKKKLEATNEAETVTRDFNNSFAPDFFMTEEELSSLNLSATLSDFIASAEVGSVNMPQLLGDRYEMVKLVDKKVAPTTLTAQVIVLDTAQHAIIDSLVTLINSGAASFEDMVARYSVDEYSKAEEGYLVFQNPTTRATDRNLTERVVRSSGLDTLLTVPTQRAFVYGEGANRMIVRVSSRGEIGPLYKIAYLEVPATFSDETFREAHKRMNNLLAQGGDDFEKIVEAAEKEGIAVRRDVSIDASSPNLGSIPSSREVVKWALQGDEGDINDNIFRCGDDYLVITCIGKTYDGDLVPFEEVKTSIINQLTADKRGDLFVEKLLAGNYKSLDAYAEAMQSVVDTVQAVSQVATPQMPAQFAGMVFATELNQLSNPFRAGSEVMVVKPLSEEKDSASEEELKARLEQEKDGVARSIGYRGFQYIISQMEIEDNRGRFF